MCIIVSHGAGLVPMVMLCARFSQSMPGHVPMLDIRCITGDHTFLFAVGYVANAQNLSIFCLGVKSTVTHIFLSLNSF